MLIFDSSQQYKMKTRFSISRNIAKDLNEGSVSFQVQLLSITGAKVLCSSPGTKISQGIYDAFLHKTCQIQALFPFPLLPFHSSASVCLKISLHFFEDSAVLENIFLLKILVSESDLQSLVYGGTSQMHPNNHERIRLCLAISYLSIHQIAYLNSLGIVFQKNQQESTFKNRGIRHSVQWN